MCSLTNNNFRSENLPMKWVLILTYGMTPIIILWIAWNADLSRMHMYLISEILCNIYFFQAAVSALFGSLSFVLQKKIKNRLREYSKIRNFVTYQITFLLTCQPHNKWKFQAQTWGEHVVYRNCFWHSEQFLYTTCSPHVLQKEELQTKIYLY